MSDKVREAQNEISGLVVAKMILDFQREFKDVYDVNVLRCGLTAVGPLQSLIGLAIRNGLLQEPKP